MHHPAHLRLPIVLALAAALSASPALAQGKGTAKGNEGARERPELIRRETDKARKELEERRKAAEKEQKAREKAVKSQFRAREEALQDRYDSRREPLRTNDGYWPVSDRRDDGRWDDGRWDDGRWDDGRGRTGGKGVPPGWCQGKGNPHNTPENCGRDGWGYGTDDGWYAGDRTANDRRYDSYDRAHADFHRIHDRQCQIRAAERPLDIQWQLRVRNECRQRHEDWHYGAGRRHE